jgi:hypothetical protein
MTYFFDGFNKQCPDCKDILPLSQFHRTTRPLETEGMRPSHLRSQCKTCRCSAVSLSVKKKRYEKTPYKYWLCPACETPTYRTKKFCGDCGEIRP